MTLGAWIFLTVLLLIVSGVFCLFFIMKRQAKLMNGASNFIVDIVKELENEDKTDSRPKVGLRKF